VTVAELNDLGREAFTAKLGHLFEHSPWVAEATWPKRPFADAAALHAALCATLQGATLERQLALIRAHPDLAGRLAQLGQLTHESTREQASAGLDRLPPEELAAFQRLNGEYREKFGFPFVICARLNQREAIVTAMRQRVANGAEKERLTALAEIEKIAWLRLQDAVNG
jgi:2-oxo-4-hydroxy-4-carboxy-5-ureidoimidazoline decarboxylase